MFQFKVKKSSKKNHARVGQIVTPSGVVNTPAFFPVGTQGSIKGVSPEEVVDTGTEGILANTYHLFLRPGGEAIKKLGSLHKIMNWHGPIMTDSAGFQIFSLGFGIEHEVGKMINLYGEKLIKGEVIETQKKEVVVRTKLCKIEEEGPTFISHLDGSAHFFPPEKSLQVQNQLGADLVVALDECTSPLHDFNYTKISMERTHRWAKRSLLEFTKLTKRKNSPKQALYNVIQGGPFEDLRINSAKYLSSLDFFGTGIGGALVDKKTMREILEWIHPHLPPERPRHLFGIGSVDDIFEAVERGVDTFDCVMPTRLGRMGHVYVNNNILFDKKEAQAVKIDRFRMDITKSVFLNDTRPIDEYCGCYACLNYSRGYISHLFRSRELFAYRLATIHNLFFMQKLMKEIRLSVEEGNFENLKKKWLNY